MKRSLLAALFATICQLIMPNAANAAVVFGQGYFPPAQFPTADSSVYGLRLSPGYAEHKEVFGLDLAIVGNHTTSKFIGMAGTFGFNITEGSAVVTGLQLAFGLNRNLGTATIVGLQVAGLSNHNKGKYTLVGMQTALGVNTDDAGGHLVGLQFAAVNEVPKTNVTGVQAGLYTRAQNVYGVQGGLYCRADKVYGIQLCWVCDTNDLYGIQIGLLNFVRNGPIKFMPLINVGF